MCIVKVCARIISQDWDNPVRRVARLVGRTWGTAVDPQKNQTLTPVYMVRYAPVLWGNVKFTCDNDEHMKELCG